MEQERIWWLVGRKIGGEATLDELRELDELLKQDAGLRYRISLMEPVERKKKETDNDTSLALSRHMQRMEALFPDDFRETGTAIPPTITPARRKRPLFIIGAVTALLAAAGSWYLYLHQNNKPNAITQESQLFTLNGSKTKAVLPDGTIVWLNGGSRILYKQSWKGEKNREVTLIGEAFFDVAKEPSQPFIIHTNNIEVRVLGTSFNIKAYPDDQTTETSLVSGAVEILIKGEQQRIVLMPSQKLIIPNKEYINTTTATITDAGSKKITPLYQVEPLTVNPVDSLVAETAWRDNYLVFENDGFSEIAAKLERWFGVKIHFDDKHLLQYRFTGKFEKETVTEILDALQFTTPFHYKVEEQEIFINQ